MSRTLTAQDRSVLIKLAASMNPGSKERRAILAGLSQVASYGSNSDIRRFNNRDWQKFPGSMPFDDGSDPLVFEEAFRGDLSGEIADWGDYEDLDKLSKFVVGIADSQGISLEFSHDEGGPTFTLSRRMDAEEAASILSKTLRSIRQGKLPNGFEHTS